MKLSSFATLFVILGTTLDFTSSQQRECTQKASDQFWWENLNGIKKITKCSWLNAKQTSDEKRAKACEETGEWSDGTTTWSPARVVCPKTCNSCEADTNSPSISLSSMPSSVPSAEICGEDKTDKFWWENLNGSKKVTRCGWLAVQNKDKKNKACDEAGEWSDGTTTWLPAREVCPITCNSCEGDTNPPSILPSSLPSSSPSAEICEEEKGDEFWWENLNLRKRVNKCAWLKAQDKEKKEKACDETVEWSDGTTTWLPAREVCPITCDSCASASPSYEPSTSPTGSPSSTPTASPSSTPSGCPENPSAKFYLITNKNGIQFKTCGWLQELSDQSRIGKICLRTASKNGKGPANEVCLNTCDTCDKANPSLSPSVIPSPVPTSEPTLSPSASPSAKPSSVPSAPPTLTPSASPSAKPSSVPSASPTLTPSASPSAKPSPVPSSMPSVSPSNCAEDPEAQFLWYIKKKTPNELVLRKCEWLQNQPGKISDICQMTITQDGYRPAREVCLDTCKTCGPSQSPSAIPSSSLSPSSPPPEFFHKFNVNSGEPMYKTCAWLNKRKSNYQKNICSSTESHEGRGPAKDVCPDICGKF